MITATQLRLALIVTTIAIAMFVLLRVQLVFEDWISCFQSTVPPHTNRPLLERLMSASGKLPSHWLEAATILPVLVTIALSRSVWIQLASFSLLLPPLILAFDTGHQCDRKGCVLRDGLGMWGVLVQIPASLLLLLVALAMWASVMIEKFVSPRGALENEFLDLNHTSKALILVSLMIPKFAPEFAAGWWRTSESGH